MVSRVGMMDIEAPYTREEILRHPDELPQRGILCPKCGMRIPQFADLKEDDRSRIRLMIILSQRYGMAIAELRSITGCSPRRAELWVEHKGRPEWDAVTTAPCPYCGKPLQTPAAKQCRHCRMDWHDANNPIKMMAVNEKATD